MKQILVATDGSESADHAVEQAINLARSSGARLIVAYVRHSPLPVLGEPVYQRSLTRELRSANETAGIAAVQAQCAGVEAETEIVDGDAAAAIMELARVRDVDLIVVGSRGRGALAGAVFGSVSRVLVRHAIRPVLVATRRAARRRAA